MTLNDKTVFITGASSGIGEASAKRFAKEGARLLLCARRLDKLRALAMSLQQDYGTEVHVMALDVCDRASVNTALKTLPSDWQTIDILLNNAGLAAGLDVLHEGDVDDWEAMIDTNVKGLLYVTRAVLPQMVARQSGHIINIGSIAGHEVYPKGAVYCATKQAVDALSRGLRMDLHGMNIRVSAVDPGAVETHFSEVRFKGDSTRAAAVYAGMTPLSADDVADAILYCATRPLHVNVSDVILMPTAQASATMVYRRQE